MKAFKRTNLGYVSQSIIGVAGLALIGLTVYITKDARALWGILLLYTVIPSVSCEVTVNNETDEEGEHQCQCSPKEKNTP